VDLKWEKDFKVNFEKGILFIFKSFCTEMSFWSQEKVGKSQSRVYFFSKFVDVGIKIGSFNTCSKISGHFCNLHTLKKIMNVFDALTTTFGEQNLLSLFSDCVFWPKNSFPRRKAMKIKENVFFDLRILLIILLSLLDK
jgi:hypothetical protein